MPFDYLVLLWLSQRSPQLWQIATGQSPLLSRCTCICIYIYSCTPGIYYNCITITVCSSTNWLFSLSLHIAWNACLSFCCNVFIKKTLLYIFCFIFYKLSFYILILIMCTCCILLILSIAVVSYLTCQKWRNKYAQSICRFVMEECASYQICKIPGFACAVNVFPTTDFNGNH